MTETSALAAVRPAPILRRREQHSPARHHLDKRAGALAEEGAAAGDPDELLTTSDVAEWLGLSSQWVEIGRGKHYGPPFVRLTPRRVRYRRADVLSWLQERTHASTAEYGRKVAADAE